MVHNQGMALTSAGRRKMSHPTNLTSGAKMGESSPPSPTKTPGGWNFVGIFSTRGRAGGRPHHHKVHPVPVASSSSNVRSALHTQQSRGKVARFGSDVAGGSTKEDGDQRLMLSLELEAPRMPLSTIFSEPDLEGGMDPAVQHLRENAELPISEDPDKRD